MFGTDLKLFIILWAFPTTGSLPCFTVTFLTTSETQMKGFPSSSATHCIGVNRLCSGFVSRWNIQAFCLDCPLCDSSKTVTKYSRLLYFCSTKNNKWNLFQKCWKAQKCHLKKEITGKERYWERLKDFLFKNIMHGLMGYRMTAIPQKSYWRLEQKEDVSFMQCSCPAMLLLSSSTGGIL